MIHYRLGKRLNIETHYNSHCDKVFEIERDLKRLHRGWGKHRVEEETHVVFCSRLNKFVTYQKGKPRYKNCYNV